MEANASHAICAGTDLFGVDWGRCSGVSGIDGDRLLQPVESAHDAWPGLPIAVQVLPGSAMATDFHIQHASLALARKGSGKRRYICGRRSRDLYSSPYMFELYAGGYCIDHASWDGVPGEVISVQFPALQVNRLLHAQGRGFELPVKHELFDARIAELTLMLWEEAAQGGPRGRLYGDGLSLALLGLLVEEHGACTRPEVRSRARLAPAQIALIRDYIDEHLCADLSVEHLAALVGSSAAHFSRSFTASFGVSPHAYVTERRLRIAGQLLLQDKSLSLADIATSVGFSSQSHFTESFRRKMGATPGQWRLG